MDRQERKNGNVAVMKINGQTERLAVDDGD